MNSNDSHGIINENIVSELKHKNNPDRWVGLDK